MLDKSTSDQSDLNELNNDTKVEVIIPTLNEEQTIGDIIRNTRSSIPHINTSIFVIDGGSTDRTLDIGKKENVKFMIQKV